MVSAKDLLVSAMVELSHDMPIRKITVAALCQKAGVSKQAFYNHFQDKYDLIARVFMKDLEAARESRDTGLSEAILARELEEVWSKRAFYREALAEDSQNSLASYIRAYTLDYNEALLKEHLQVTELTEEQKVLVRYHSDGSIGIFQDWLCGAIHLSPSELAAAQYTCMPDVLKEAWGKE